MSPRRQAKATHSSPGQRWQRNNNSRHHSSLMPISSFPPAPPTRGWLCQPLCLGCQGQRPARCNTRSRTPSGNQPGSALPQLWFPNGLFAKWGHCVFSVVDLKPKRLMM
uniref:Uncharacterized protein n=1 Tax=Felis catus TaxID=9685 RepID=A0ABI7Z235_FELCA